MKDEENEQMNEQTDQWMEKRKDEQTDRKDNLEMSTNLD